MDHDQPAAHSAGDDPAPVAATTDPDHRVLGRSRPSPPGWDGTPLDRYGQIGEALDRAREVFDRRSVRIAAAAFGVVVAMAWWLIAGGASGGGSAPSGPFTSGGTTIPLAVPHTSERDHSSTTDESAPSPTGEAGEELVVHAAGAVVAPGVYRLPGGARVGDLITAAGGLTADADGDRLNLAEPLADGVRVYVPHRGETDVPSVQDVDGPGGSAGSSGDGTPTGESPMAPAKPVDINDATLDQLDELPGVGPATAQAIISHREQNGPFGSVDELLEVRGIGPAKLEQLRPLVTV